MKKSEAIRNIVAKHGMALTNQEIMNLCLSEHRLHCTSTQIIGTIGAYHDRMAIAGFAPDLLQAARKYVALVGNLSLAKKIMEVAVTP